MPTSLRTDLALPIRGKAPSSSAHQARETASEVSRGYYVIVRGPLGSGKTTLARQLARKVHGKYIAIDEILESENLERWYRGYVAERSFLRANQFAVRRAAPFLRKGIPVVFDGNFYYRSAVEDLIRRLRFPHLVITLKLPLSVCIERDAGRRPSYGAEATREVFRKTTAFDYGVKIDAMGSVATTLRRLLREVHQRTGQGRYVQAAWPNERRSMSRLFERSTLPRMQARSAKD